jgi:hypothetical protein
MHIRIRLERIRRFAVANRYPCPNPICTHQFEAAQMTGVASVTCPQCGMVIKLTPTELAKGKAIPKGIPVAPPQASKTTANGSVPTAAPVAPGAARPVAVAVPLHVEQPAASQLAGLDAGPILRAAPPKKNRDWLTYTLWLGGFFLLLSLAVGAFLVQMTGGLGGGRSGPPVLKSTDRNYSFEKLDKTWNLNEDLKIKLNIDGFVYQRDDPACWLALDTRDFKDHNPSPKELDQEARKKLIEYFRGVETEPPAGAALKNGQPIANQTTYRFVFLGELDGEHVSGECHFFSFQGIGYWLYNWAPADKAKNFADEFAQLRGRFALIGEREAWKQLQQSFQVYESKSGYQIVDRTGRWQPVKNEEPTDSDPNAEIVLWAADPNEPNLIARRTRMIAMVIPFTGKDAIATAKAYILAKHKADSYDMAKIEDAYEEGESPKTSVGEIPGHLLRWRIEDTPSLVQFATVGIVPKKDKLILLYAQCDNERRVTWEAQYQQLMESFRWKSD